MYKVSVLRLKKYVLGSLILVIIPAKAEYQSYGISEQIDYLLIPKTHIWRDNPRMWTIKQYLDSESKFSLVYALQEADCDRNKLRYRSQTWVIRNDSEEDQLLTDTSVKKWRTLKSESFEEILHTFTEKSIYWSFPNPARSPRQVESTDGGENA